MGVVKVESFDVNVATATGTTHTLTNTVTLANAFLRRVGSIDKQSGLTTSTGNCNANNACISAWLSSTTQVSFAQNASVSQKVTGEIWRYTGSSGGADEFIVRGRHTITLTSTTTGSTAVSGISDVDKCIPFFTGATQTANTVSDFDASTVAVWLDASGNIQVERGSSTGTFVVYVTVVEFTGGNWKVGHALSSSHDSTTETVTMNTASTGTGGSTFDVGSWEKAMIIEGSLEGDTSETGLSDNLGSWIPNTTSSMDFFHLQDSGSRNDGKAFGHVLYHPAFVMHRDSNTNISEGNGTYATNAGWPTGASTTESIDELSLEWFSDTSGTGTAHARGRLSAQITSASGTIQYYVHRSGNNVSAYWGVLELSGVDNTEYIGVNSIDGDGAVSNSQTNVVILGSAFEASQGTGKVELVQYNDYTGTKVTQSIDSWSDTSIQIDISASTLADSKCFVFVTNDSGGTGFASVTVGIPPETYQEVVEGMTNAPDHYWTFQNTYDDEIGSATANAGASTGTSFDSTIKLVKGDTHTLLIDSTTDTISPDNQTDMNSSSISRRYVGGWFQLSNISQGLAVMWEEGAQVNNMALLVGFGNNMVYQIANASDDYIQLYVNKPLTPQRTYHFMAKFHASGYDSGECELYLDGVLQDNTNGNPWETAQLDSHTGSISWGHQSGESLKVGDDRGVDATTIAFVSPTNCNYAHWYSWSDITLTPATDIRVTLFEKGAPATYTIAGDTEANMQTAIDAYADTLMTDAPCALEIATCTDGDFELSFDNITFEDRVSIQVRYMGVDTLTIVLENGSEVDTDKMATPYGGTFDYSTPASFTVDGLVAGSTVSIYDNETANGINLDSRLAYVASSGTSLGYAHSGVSNDIVVQVLKAGYVEIIQEYTLGSVDQTLTVSQAVDTNL